MTCGNFMDKIFIQGLKTDAVIGIYDWEKQIRQTLVLDLELATDIRKAASSDRIEDTLNYKSISKQLVEYIRSNRFELVETLAEHLAKLLVEEFPISEVWLKLHKPGALSDAEDVGIIISRSADDYQTESPSSYE